MPFPALKSHLSHALPLVRPLLPLRRPPSPQETWRSTPSGAYSHQRRSACPTKFPKTPIENLRRFLQATPREPEPSTLTTKPDIQDHFHLDLSKHIIRALVLKRWFACAGGDHRVFQMACIAASHRGLEGPVPTDCLGGIICRSFCWLFFRHRSACSQSIDVGTSSRGVLLLQACKLKLWQISFSFWTCQSLVDQFSF